MKTEPKNPLQMTKVGCVLFAPIKEFSKHDNPLVKTRPKAEKCWRVVYARQCLFLHPSVSVNVFTYDYEKGDRHRARPKRMLHILSEIEIKWFFTIDEHQRRRKKKKLQKKREDENEEHNNLVHVLPVHTEKSWKKRKKSFIQSFCLSCLGDSVMNPPPSLPPVAPTFLSHCEFSEFQFRIYTHFAPSLFSSCTWNISPQTIENDETRIPTPCEKRKNCFEAAIHYCREWKMMKTFVRKSRAARARWETRAPESASEKAKRGAFPSCRELSPWESDREFGPSTGRRRQQ